MTISLYDASVASYLQILGGVSGFLDRGRSHCEENGSDPDELPVPVARSGELIARQGRGARCLGSHVLGPVAATKHPGGLARARAGYAR